MDDQNKKGTGSKLERRESRIAEFIMSGILSEKGGSGVGKLYKKALLFARRHLGYQTLFIRYQIGGREILLPFQHDLPLFSKSYPQYSTNVGRLCVYVEKKYPGFQMIDIGANVGDTVAIVREHSDCPVLCIEGNQEFFSLLEENLKRGKFKAVTAVHALVSTYTGELKGQIVSSFGSAHFVEDAKASMHSSKLSDILERHPEFGKPKFLKIDTDGFDCSILRSELDWLQANRPSVFFEYDPYFFQKHEYDGKQIFRDMSRIGYKYVIFYDYLGDYLVSLDLQNNQKEIKELQNYFVGRSGAAYMDILLLHQEDADLAEDIRKAETQWSIHLRSQIAQSV